MQLFLDINTIYVDTYMYIYIYNFCVFQLTPIEKYAMKFLEESDEGLIAEAERLAAEIEQQKKEWEMGRIQAMREEEDRLRQEESDEMLVYSSSDSRNQVSSSSKDSDEDNSSSVSDSSDDESDDDSSSEGDEEHSKMNNVERSRKKTSENSPRTRSRGHVSINLWTLDENPLPACRNKYNSPKLRCDDNSDNKKLSPSPVALSPPTLNGDLNGHNDNEGVGENEALLNGDSAEL